MNISENFGIELIKSNTLKYEQSKSTFLNKYQDAVRSFNVEFILQNIHQFLLDGKVVVDSPVDGSKSLAIASIGSIGAQYILMQSDTNYWVIVQNLEFIDCIILKDRLYYFNSEYWKSPIVENLSRALEYFDKIETPNSDLKGFFLNNKRPYHFFYDQLSYATYIEERFTDIIEDNYSFVFYNTFVDPDIFLKNSSRYVESTLGEVYLRPCLILHHRTRDNEIDFPLLMESRLLHTTKKTTVDFENYDFVLWIGVTGQKRIWVEQIEGYASIIKLLSKNFSNILVVVDGWTAPYGEEVVLLEEEHIFNKIRKSCGDVVSFISVIGKDYYHKIAVCKHIDYFIANAGTGCMVPLRFCRKDGVLHTNSHLVTFPDNYDARGQNVKLVEKEFIKDVDIPVKKIDMVSYHINWKVLYNLLVKLINIKLNNKLDEIDIKEGEELVGDITISLEKWQKELVKNKIIPNDSIFVDLLRDLALRFENHGDLDTAFALMVEAKKLRPEGPFIEQKTLEYYNKLNKTE